MDAWGDAAVSLVVCDSNYTIGVCLGNHCIQSENTMDDIVERVIGDMVGIVGSLLSYVFMSYICTDIPPL